MILKWLWYSPYLFGNIWHKYAEVKEKKMRSKFIAYPLTFLNGLLLSYFISLIEIYVGATSFWDGATAGFILWLGFAFTSHVTTVIWVKKNMKPFLIKQGFLLLIFMIMGAILVG